MNGNNKRCYEILEKLDLHPRVVTHEAILNYEVALKVDRELGLTGTESKTLFLKGKKSGNHYLFITLASERMDSKFLKNLLGEKIQMVTGDEMVELTGMMPGCMIPFGLQSGLIQKVVVDNKIDSQEKLILAFGSEHMSVEMTPSDLKQILDYEYSDSVIYVDVVENG